MRRIALLLLLGACTLGGCTLGTSPEDEARLDLGGEPGGGGDDDDGDETHRPGQPCLVCHRDGYNPGEKLLVIAGTVYLRPSDTTGLEGATIAISDAAGRAFEMVSNRTGNFMVQVKTSLSAPEQKSKGRVKIPWQPTFPLRVEVRYAGTVKEMKSMVWRDGSCAGCHVGSVGGEESVPRVFILEDGQ